IVDRRDRLTAAAQLTPRVALREQRRAQYVEHLAPVALRYRAAALHVDACVRARFVDRLPAEREVAERLGAECDVARPVVRAGAVVYEPALAGLGEPARQREVVETYPRMDAGRNRGFEHRAVVLDRSFVAPAFERLDARPLDRQPVVPKPVLRVQ